MAEALRILVVEDEALFAEALAKHLGRAGHRCTLAGSLHEALEALKAAVPDVLLVDERLPDGNGLDLLRKLHNESNTARPAIIVMTAFGDVEHAVTAMKLGAVDYLTKPVDLEELSRAVARVRRPQAATAADLAEAPELLGDSPPLRRARARIAELAALGKPNAGAPLATVLITGETGTGKDLAARLIQAAAPNRDAPFVQIDCAALPKDLIEAELFGHERGAFTGARAPRAGLAESAGEGTILLNEIGELPLDLQSKLLTLLDRRLVRRIGSNKERPVRARFLAATNRDLESAAQAGTFRPDLLYRLRVLTLELPALRDCTEDILLLAHAFAAHTAAAYGRPRPAFTREAEAKLVAHDWPGNARELKHVVESVVLLNRGAPVTADEIELASARRREATAPVESKPDIQPLDQAERRLIERALERSGGNVSKAARLLDTTRMRLRYRMEKHGIRAPRQDG